MKTRAITFLFSILWIPLSMGILSCDTASSIEDPDLNYFVKYYGGDGNQKGVDMLALNDGSFLLLGNADNNSIASNVDIYLVKVNAEGDIIWEKRYEQGILNAKDIEPTRDGNFIILADVQTSIGSPTNIKLIKISPDGIMLDSQDFGPEAANDYGKTVTVLDDGGFIVSGTTDSTRSLNNPTIPDPDLGNAINYRFDQNLDRFSNSEWSPISPGFDAQLDVAVKAVETDSGFFYVFGYSTANLNNTNPNESLTFFYFNRGKRGSISDNYAPGNTVDANDTEIQFVLPVAPELGEGFIIIGTSQDNIGLSDIFVAKMRSSLTFTDSDHTIYYTIPLPYTAGGQRRNVRGVSAANSLTGDFGYLVLGNEVRSTGALNIWLTKIDQSGRVIWSSTFGSEEEDDSGAAVCELPDGKILILGTMGLADNQSKMALIKLNPGGELLK